MTRYALYFAPAADSPWWNAGRRWLGRDPASGALFPQSQAAGVPRLLLAKLTVDARRYGFHATLKAPFHMKTGFGEAHLLAMAQAFCAVQQPLVVRDVEPRAIGDFLALRPAAVNDELGALAMRCVSYFDLLRAPPSADETGRRHRSALTGRQQALLARWGYPYTEEEFRFHLTLTDSLAALDGRSIDELCGAAEMQFANARAAAPLTVDAMTIYREESPGAPLMVWRRFPFVGKQAALPAEGRLFFLVGASGAGKDSVLQWVRERLPANAKIAFAQRTITRPRHPTESHEEVDEDEFQRLAADGHFSMLWHANGLYYGIRRGIEADLKAGCDVVVNGSREFVPQLRSLFPAAQVIWLEADASLIRDRIAMREREAGPALLRRFDRIKQFSPPGDGQVIRLDNNGPIEAAGRRLLEILSGVRD